MCVRDSLIYRHRKSPGDDECKTTRKVGLPSSKPPGRASFGTASIAGPGCTRRRNFTWPFVGYANRRNRVQLVEEGGCRVASITRSQDSRSTAGKDVPAGTVAVVRSPDFLRALNQRDCACNIDPPASSYAIMRRAGPYRGENPVPGKDVRGELDPTPGIRERPRPKSDIRRSSLRRCTPRTGLTTYYSRSVPRRNRLPDRWQGELKYSAARLIRFGP